MNIRKNVSTLVLVAVVAAVSTPVFAQSEGGKSSGKTYKRKLYSGKDADKYRSMDLPAMPDGRRGGSREEDADAPARRSRHVRAASRKDERAEQVHLSDEPGRTAVRVEDEDSEVVQDRREPETRENSNEKQSATAKEGRANNDHSNARSAERGSRKEMRRSARREKWSKGSDGQ